MVRPLPGRLSALSVSRLNSLKRRFPARAVFEKLFAKLGDRLATTLRAAEKADARQKRGPNPAQAVAAFKPPGQAAVAQAAELAQKWVDGADWGAAAAHPPAGGKERRNSSPERRRSARR